MSQLGRKYSQKLVSLCAYKNKYLTGTIKGDLIIWCGNKPTKSSKPKLFPKALDTIQTTDQGVLLGDRSGLVIMLNESLQETHKFTLTEIEGVISVHPGINAIHLEDQRLIIGTRGSEIFEFQFDVRSGEIDYKDVVTHGHFHPCKKDNNEVWGLATFPNKDQYVTTSDDGTLRVWDVIE